jgi:tetratricopeptide (TPR) repeat protein/transglutaminase-like putative cysteine protease
MSLGRGGWLVGLALFSFGAFAATDLPLIQPPADWVKPVAIDPTPSKLAKDAPTAVLLQDYQARFQPDITEFYHEFAIKAQTPQGLPAIGSVTLPWDPATQRLIIHKLKVIRAGQEIDYLTTGPGFLTLRRETKLEAATLDGTLTATTQLEGLEVGDILDVAYTVEEIDPIMKGHLQAHFTLTMGPIHRFHLHALWPTSVGMTWRGIAHAPEPTIRTKGEWTEASLDRIDPVDPTLPKGAPQRYLWGAELQFSNFAGWSDVSAVLAKEFADAESSAPGSPLMEEAKSIAARTPDPKARAEAALTLVQDKIRYVLLALDGGGLKPAAADLTWSRRFADCKGKTVVLLSLLHRLGIEAEPALVSSQTGDGLDQRQPRLLGAFDHVLVRAIIDGRVYWLDGTRTGDRILDKIRTPPFRWALPVRATGGELIRLELQDFDEPPVTSSLRLDATAGLTLPAVAHGEMILRGDAAQNFNQQISGMTPVNADLALKDYWRKRDDFITASSVSAHYDAAAQEEKLTLDGTAALDWKTGGGYEVNDIELHKFDFQRDPGPDDDAPFQVAYPRFERHSVTVILPNQGNGFSFIGDQVDEVASGVHIRRPLSLANGVFSAEMEFHAVSPEIPVADALAAVKRLTDLSKRAVRILPGPKPQTTPAEHAALIASTPQTAGEYVDRGNALLNEGKFAPAQADFDQAILLDPAMAVAWGDRAMTWAWRNDFAKAAADADAALKLDPKQIVALRTKALIETRQRHWLAAIPAYDAVLAVNHTDLFSLIRRSEAYLQISDPISALQDTETGLAAEPRNVALLNHKGLALTQLDRNDEAALLARSLIADHADNPDVLIIGARLLRLAGQDAEAGAAMDKAVALKPSADTLLSRADLWPFGNLDRGLADAKQAFDKGGQARRALMTLAELNYQARNYAEALRWGNQAAQDAPDDMNIQAFLAEQQHALGQDAAARATFARVREAASGDGEALNRLCWSEATVSFDLSAALADCDAALQSRPNAAHIADSRAFVLLRMGRDAEAMAQYETAWAGRPAPALALFGRSLAEQRTGRAEAAERDRKEAIHKDKYVVDWFRLYGLTD